MAGITTSTPDVSAALFAAQAKQQANQTPYTGQVSEEDRARIQQKSKEFESFYIYQTLELMTPEMDGEFSGGVGEEMFRHTLNEQMAESITNSGGFGIADTVYKELLRNQEMRAATLAEAAKTYATSAR